MAQVGASETGSATGEHAEEITPDSPQFGGISFRTPDGAVTEYQGPLGQDMVVITKLVQRDRAADPRDAMDHFSGFEWLEVTDGRVNIDRTVGKLALKDETVATLVELCGDGQGGLDPELFTAAESQMRESMQADPDFDSALKGGDNLQAAANHFFQTGEYRELSIIPDIAEAVGEAKQTRIIPTATASIEDASSELESISNGT